MVSLLSVEIRAHRLDDINQLAFIRDISERKHAEQMLQERIAEEERLTRIVATAPDMIGSFRQRPDGSTYFIYASPAMEQISGLRPAELEHDAAPFFARIHPDDIKAVEEAMTRIGAHTPAVADRLSYSAPRERRALG